MSSDSTLTVEKLRKMRDLLGDLPPVPFFASSILFPAEHALKFVSDRREHVGAHPDFWAKVPGTAGGLLPFCAGIEIVDLDHEHNSGRREQFFLALASAMDARS